MKVSIWQQFSSNHSSSFVVMGEFKSPEDAQKAAEELKSILQVIRQTSPVDSEDFDKPTPQELYFADKYDIDWQYHLAWVYDEQEHVSILDNWLFVTNADFDTRLGPDITDKLVEKLGGKVQVSREMGATTISVDMSWVAPDETTALMLYEALNTYVEFDKSDETLGFNFPIPWVAYANGVLHPQAEKLLALEKIYFERKRIPVETEREWNKNNRVGNLDEIRKQRLESVTALSHDEDSFVWNERKDAGIMTRNESKVEMDGLKLSLQNVSFSYHLGKGMNAIIAWLKANGCTDIEYSFREFLWV